MSNFISVDEYAKQKGVSVQAVYKRLKTTLKPYLKIVDGKKMIDISMLNADNTQDTIKQGFKDNCKDDLIQLYERLLADKDKQIEQMNNHINELTRLLSQQQQLQLIQSSEPIEIIPTPTEPTPEPEPDEPKTETEPEVYTQKEPPPSFKRLLNSVFKRKGGGKVSKQAEQ